MSQTVLVKNSNTCQFRDGTHLACQLEADPSANALSAKTTTLARPVLCDLDPTYAAANAGGRCLVRDTNGTTSCGCPELNNPTLKSAYKRSVMEVVLGLAENQSEITLTFFASGGLRNECGILSEILSELEARNWTSGLNIQFVDPEYAVHKTEQIQRGSEHLQFNWGYKAGTALATVFGIGLIWVGTTQKDKKARKYYYVAGIASIAIAFALSTQVLASKPMPRSIKLNPTFFSSAQLCIRDGKQMDGVFAYDFGGDESKRDYLLL